MGIHRDAYKSAYLNYGSPEVYGLVYMVSDTYTHSHELSRTIYSFSLKLPSSLSLSLSIFIPFYASLCIIKYKLKLS